MKAFATLLVFILFVNTALPCIWITGTKYNGDSVSTGLGGAFYLRSALKADRRADGERMEAELRGATNFNDRSDYSVALMFLGRSEEAVALLNQLEKENPGQYFIAANLGTAYELSGNNEEALKWIKEGIHRDPASHEGTEWLHVKILEAKIAQQKDTNYFKSHSVLELRPEKIGAEVTVGDQKFSPKEITDAIQYQLRERMQFVKPRDQVVAGLLFDYAAIEAATETLESAEKILQMAREYGYPSDKIQPLLELYNRRIAWRKTKRDIFYTSLAVGVVCLFVYWYKKGIFVLSSRDLKR
jgi:tetratricopeptide (TPR) repeat protein